MSVEFEQILQGKFNYLKSKQVFCEENFKITKQNSSRGDFLFSGEVLSRAQNGEFLKIEVNYQTTFDFSVKRVEIDRNMGGRKSSETFDLDAVEKKIDYYFQGANGSHRESQSYSGALQIASPSFALSFIATLKKRLDPVHRTQYTIFHSDNIWNFETSPHFNNISVEHIDLNPVTIKVAGKSLTTTHCAIFDDAESRLGSTSSKIREEIYFSKHFSIPYKGVFKNGIIIEVSELKVEEDRYSGLF